MDADELWESLDLTNSSTDRLIVHEIARIHVDGFDPDPNQSATTESDENDDIDIDKNGFISLINEESINE